MANQEHVDRLLQGVEAWNQWRKENPEIKPDLSKIDSDEIDLSDIDLGKMKLSGVILSEAILNGVDLNHADLRKVNLSEACLNEASLSYADLNEANLAGASFLGTKLIRADLTGANLSQAVFSQLGMYSKDLIEDSFTPVNIEELERSTSNLSQACLEEADLSGADLSGINLNRCNLSRASLEGTNLTEVKAIGTDFTESKFTGACIYDWKISGDTKLDGVICEHIFLKSRPQYRESFEEEQRKPYYDRRPHDPNQTFAPGEFTKRYQIVLETVDLFFNDGIDWTAFLDSLHDLQSQYGDELSIRDIGRRAGGSFVVQLEVPPESDKGTIERQAKELYATKLQQLEAHYQERLQLRGEQLLFFQEQVGIERIRNTRLERIIETMAEKDSPKYDLRGAKFGGGFAADGGTQTGGTFNDFSQNIEQNINEIGGLIQSLRSQAEAFPEGIRQETLEHLGDLESDIQQPPEQRKPSRIKATLLALAGMATLVSGAVAGANEFAGNLQELSEKLGLSIPIEQLQPQSQPDAIDVQAIGSDRS